MARTYFSLFFIAFFLGVMLLGKGTSIDATSAIEKRRLLPQWCIAKEGLGDATLQRAIDYYCFQPKMNCNLIKPGGPCFKPDTKYYHASFAINLYYNVTPKADCPKNVGQITYSDPSYGACKYPSS